MNFIKLLVVFSFSLISFPALAECFHGWKSMEWPNDKPAGFCTGELNNGHERIWTELVINFQTQKLYLRGQHFSRNSTGIETGTWLGFYQGVLVNSCYDLDSEWTEITASGGPVTDLAFTYRELREVHPTGSAKKAFEAEATLKMKLNNDAKDFTLSCTRYVF